MSKTVVVTIHEPYLQILERWASVSRTLNLAEKACEELAEILIGEDGQEQALHTAGELTEITPALDHLHQQVRSQLWALNVNEVDSLMVADDVVLSESQKRRKRFLEIEKRLHSLIATKVELGQVSLVNAFNLCKYVPTDEQPVYSGPAEALDSKTFHQLLERRYKRGSEG